MSFGDATPEYEFVHDDALIDPVLDRELRRLDIDSGAEIDDLDSDHAAPAGRTTTQRKKRVGATAAMFTALAMAYREVFEPDKAQEIVMEVEADEPFLDGPVQVFLEPGNPRAGRIIVRKA